MKKIQQISTLTTSAYINFFRQQLLRRGYFEHSIYNTVSKKLEGSISFPLPHGLFLRYGTEPDVWIVGEKYQKFFFIGSLFRNEPKRSKIHNYEFKLIDFYVQGGTVQDVLYIFFGLLRKVEKEFDLPSLSSQPVSFITHEKFYTKKEKIKMGWVIVTEYPIQESFYDVRVGKNTKKFEVLFRNKNETTEIASAGVVGPNLNRSMYFMNENEKQNKYNKIFRKKFIGLGFGVERLIYVYKKNKK